MKILIFSTIILLVACNQQKKNLLNDGSGQEVVKENPSPTPEPTPTPTPAPAPVPPPGQGADLKICSKLDLDNVTWPSELTPAEWTYYALGLNITGSFEGNSGWKNISGNFDGQGLSLGLMQQNLGQGSLQPWLVQMFKEQNGTMLNNFNNSDYKSLKSMLETWQGSNITAQERDDEPLFPESLSNNALEIDFDKSIDQQSGENSKSVQWAKQTILDSSGNVTSRWKKSFQDMAISAGYRSFQLEASLKIFLKAKEYFAFFKFKELRSLLFLFDIVVQNGGIASTHLAKYNTWLSSHANADEQSKALALLEARLTTVRPQYVADVRSRKQAIIYGRGTVHQTPRNFPQEYCFDPRVNL